MFVLTHLSAQIAQLVEQRTENPRVTGSIPVLGTSRKAIKYIFARVAQLVEHDLAKVGVAGSSPVSRSLKPVKTGFLFCAISRHAEIVLAQVSI